MPKEISLEITEDILTIIKQNGDKASRKMPYDEYSEVFEMFVRMDKYANTQKTELWNKGFVTGWQMNYSYKFSKHNIQKKRSIIQHWCCC